MVISSYGSRCVRIETKEGSVLIDLFDPKETGLRGPVANDDLVLLSAHDQPKSVTERINESAFVIRGPGEYERKGIGVRGIAAHQDSQQGKELGLCTIFSIMAEEMSICHLGALGQEKLTEEQLEAIGDPDILIIPSGGQSALDAKAAAALATQIEPKIIIPVHTGTGSEKFAKELGLQPEKLDVLRIAKKQLPVDQTKLVVLGA